LFLLMLVFSGVFFALGYVMGRNQYDGQVRAESTPRATPDPVFQSKNDLAARRQKNSQSAASSSNSTSSSNTASATSGSSGSGWGSLSPSPPGSTSRDSASAPPATPDDSATPSSDWNFYNSAKSVPDDRLRPASATPSASSISASPTPAVAAGKNPKATNGSSSVASNSQGSASSKALIGANGVPIPAGSYVLQVAAMRQSGDANAVVTSLRLKHFPAFVVNPTTDKYYHVQVGPYHDVKSADAAKKGLENAGFKAIVKH